MSIRLAFVALLAIGTSCAVKPTVSTCEEATQRLGFPVCVERIDTAEDWTAMAQPLTTADEPHTTIYLAPARPGARLPLLFGVYSSPLHSHFDLLAKGWPSLFPGLTLADLDALTTQPGREFYSGTLNEYVKSDGSTVYGFRVWDAQDAAGTVTCDDAAAILTQMTQAFAVAPVVMLPSTDLQREMLQSCTVPFYDPPASGATTPPAITVPATATPALVSGTTTEMSVEASDDAGEPSLVYTWSASGPAPVTFGVNGTNASKHTTAFFTTSGAYAMQVTATDAAGLTATSVASVMVDATPSVVTVLPTSTSVAPSEALQLSAFAIDQFGARIVPPPAFTWTVSGGGTITVDGRFTAPSSAGTSTVTATTGNSSGTASILVASVPTPPTIAIAASAAPNPVSGTIATLSALGSDAGGAASLVYTWSATGPAAVNISPNGTNAAKTATATFSKAGAYVFSVNIENASGLSVVSTVNVSVMAKATTIAVAPALAAVAAGATQQFSANASDQFGALLSVQPAFTWSVSGGGTISSSGLFNAGTVGGAYTVTATGGGASGTATAQVMAAPAPTGPTVATPVSATPNPVTATTTTVSVLGADALGEPSLTYTWSSSGPAAVTFSANGTNAAKTATARFSKAGSYALSATIRNSSGLTTTSTVAVTVSSTVTSLSVVPGSATLAPGGTQQFNASAVDQFGAPIVPQPTVMWGASGGGTITTDGLFTAGVAGTYTVTAATGTVSGAASVVVTTSTGPSVAVAAAASPSTVTGTTSSLSVLGSDPAGEASLTYTWTASPSINGFTVNGTNAAKTTTAEFEAAGTYVMTVTIRNPSGQIATSSVTVVVNQKPTKLTVTPGFVTLIPGSTQQFTAQVTDQFGALRSPQPMFTWALSGGGTVSSTGLFTAGSVLATETITATGAGISGSASLTVASTTINPCSFDRARAYNQYGNILQLESMDQKTCVWMQRTNTTCTNPGVGSCATAEFTVQAVRIAFNGNLVASLSSPTDSLTWVSQRHNYVQTATLIGGSTTFTLELDGQDPKPASFQFASIAATGGTSFAPVALYPVN